MTTLHFVMRRPRLPIIIDTQSGLIGAKSWVTCAKRLSRLAPGDLKDCVVIDADARLYMVAPDPMALCPTATRQWTKLAIIKLYNSKKPGGCQDYPVNSLGNKPVEKVVKDLVDLLNAAS